MNSKRPLWSLTIRRTSTWPAITISNASQASKTELIPTGYRSTTGYLHIARTCARRLTGNLKRENRFTEARLSRHPIFHGYPLASHFHGIKNHAITKISEKIPRDDSRRSNPLINRTNYELVIDRIDRENIRIVPFLPFSLTTRVACFRRIREKEDWKGITITRRCENTQDRKNER